MSRILLADDHPMIRTALEVLLRDTGYEIVGTAAADDGLRLVVVNDGADFPVRGERPEMPTSLRERVEQAGGVLDMARGMGVTKFSISLPIGEPLR